MSTTNPPTDERRQFAIRLPRPVWIFVATLVVVVAFLPVRAWLLNSWQKQTIEQFMRFARQGELAKCRAMLAEDHSAVWTLDEHALRIAGDRPLVTEPTSYFDYVLGKQRFRVDLAISNDHGFTVAGGRVTLGRSFWIHSQPGPEFRLTREGYAAEGSGLREQGQNQTDD